MRYTFIMSFIKASYESEEVNYKKISRGYFLLFGCHRNDVAYMCYEFRFHMWYTEEVMTVKK